MATTVSSVACQFRSSAPPQYNQHSDKNNALLWNEPSKGYVISIQAAVVNVLLALVGKIRLDNVKPNSTFIYFSLCHASPYSMSVIDNLAEHSFISKHFS